MIEITKDQCTRMLVWDCDESLAFEALVAYKLKASEYPYKTFNGSMFRHAKPLPEEKPMTALDVMWWAGARKVVRYNGNDRIFNANCYDSTDNLEDWRFNYLIRENGETKLKYFEWKEFTFANCDMEG
jgi:hypothetical protein